MEHKKLHSRKLIQSSGLPVMSNFVSNWMCSAFSWYLSCIDMYKLQQGMHAVLQMAAVSEATLDDMGK